MASDEARSERQRVPQPVIKRRIASGRGAMEQPNATSDDAPLTPKFWLAVLLTGVATGLGGIALMWVLTVFERWGFHFKGGSFQDAVAAVSSVRRVVVLMISAVVGALGWYLIRKYMKGMRSEIDDALWRGDGELSWRRSALTGVLSEVVIGLGASIGREAAPKLLGGASAAKIARWFSLSPQQKRLLVACGGGAGLAAVYNVPLGGAIFTAEVLYGSFSLPVVVPALATSLIATFVGWWWLPSGPTYLSVPAFPFSASLMAWSIPAGVLAGLISVGYVRAVGWASHYRARGAHIFWAMPVAFAAVGLGGVWYPQLFGNGKDMAHQAFLGGGTTLLFFALFALKPLATSVTLVSGASGGIFTPFLSTGAVFGAFTGGLWLHWWPGAPIGAFAMVGAAAMIGASMQAPLAGLVLVLEMTHSGFDIMIPMLSATFIATYLVRHLDGYSIYSARLPYEGEG